MISIFLKRLFKAYQSPKKFAKNNGVQFGKGCLFRTKQFGSEPYLIELGNHVHTARGVSFVTHDGGLHVIRRLYAEYKSADLFGKIKIGNNVFLGLNSTIMFNTIIGDNVIIGAHSVVRGVIEPNSVYAGVPAKRICSIEEYLEKNKEYLVHTKHMDRKEKNEFLTYALR